MQGALNQKSWKFAVFGVIFGVAMFAIGFFTYPTFSYQNNTESLEEIEFGGYLTMELYDQDGNLKSIWEEHNDLTPAGRNALVSCISGLDTTPFGYDAITLNQLCSGFVDRMFILLANPSSTIELTATNTLTPAGCDPDDFANLCEGWKSEATADFNTLSCTAGVDCPNINSIQLLPPVGGFHFNFILVTPSEEVTPGDRLIATITFSIP